MKIKYDYYINKLIRKKGNGFIKILTWFIRIRKSYLFNNLFYNYLIQICVYEKHIIKFAFDSGRDLLKIFEDLIVLDVLIYERL